MLSVREFPGTPFLGDLNWMMPAAHGKSRTFGGCEW